MARGRGLELKREFKLLNAFSRGEKGGNLDPQEFYDYLKRLKETKSWVLNPIRKSRSNRLNESKSFIEKSNAEQQSSLSAAQPVAAQPISLSQPSRTGSITDSNAPPQSNAPPKSNALSKTRAVSGTSSLNRVRTYSPSLSDKKNTKVKEYKEKLNKRKKKKKKKKK